MGETLHIPSPEHLRHSCSLGGALWGVSQFGERSLHRCGDCGRWWYPVRLRDGHGRWLPVRWFQFRLRRRIAEVPR